MLLEVRKLNHAPELTLGGLFEQRIRDSECLGELGTPHRIWFCSLKMMLDPSGTHPARRRSAKDGRL